MFIFAIQQDYLKKIEERFGKDGSKLFKMAGKDFINQFNMLYESMKVGLNKTTGAGLLKDYSPWLSNFQANTYSEIIEIPGNPHNGITSLSSHPILEHSNCPDLTFVLITHRPV